MFRHLALSAALVLTTAIPVVAANPTVGGAEMLPDRTVVENLTNSADHTTLVAALTATELADTLSGEGPFTVFAPTDAAFAKLPEATLADLMKPDNSEALTGVLSCHVIGALGMSDTARKAIAQDGGTHEMPTLGDCGVTASLVGDSWTLTDGHGNVATVTQADVVQGNGVLHVIDTVLMPKM